jgi:hypothetical protein
MTIHPVPGRRRAGRRPFLLFTCLLVAALVGITIAWQPPDRAGLATHLVATDSPAPDAVPTTGPVTAGGESTAAMPPTERTPVATPDPVLLPTFERMIEQLVALGRLTAERAQADDIAAAEAADAEARALMSSLLQRFHDAGERAMAVLAGQPEPSTDERQPARRVVLQLVLAADLARRHEQAVAVQDRSRIDPLVESLLGVMPQAAGTTEVGAQLLGGQPYLQSVHERAVLALLQLAGEGTFPRDVATRLLSTLWDNLQRTGERSSAELSQLAMLLLTEDAAAERVVACRQLIADPRFRAMALAWLREHGDTAVATDIAGLAAREMAPEVAWAVLRELAPILPRATGAYMVLGSRAPELVADAYRELLAANTQPSVRTDLVAGVGFTGSAQALTVAQLALHNDPSPEVRIQSGFVLTATGDADAGERALNVLLDDPVIAGDATRLGAIVLALHNLEAGGATNNIDRLGQRLCRLPLSDSSRQSLEALLARSLPGGSLPMPAPGLPRGTLPRGTH